MSHSMLVWHVRTSDPQRRYIFFFSANFTQLVGATCNDRRGPCLFRTARVDLRRRRRAKTGR